MKKRQLSLLFVTSISLITSITLVGSNEDEFVKITKEAKNNGVNINDFYHMPGSHYHDEPADKNVHHSYGKQTIEQKIIEGFGKKYANPNDPFYKQIFDETSGRTIEGIGNGTQKAISNLVEYGITEGLTWLITEAPWIVFKWYQNKKEEPNFEGKIARLEERLHEQMIFLQNARSPEEREEALNRIKNLSGAIADLEMLETQKIINQYKPAAHSSDQPENKEHDLQDPENLLEDDDPDITPSQPIDDLEEDSGMSLPA